MYPLIIQTIAAEHVKEYQERAARTRLAKQVRRRHRDASRTARPQPGRTMGPLSLVRAVSRAKA